MNKVPFIASRTGFANKLPSQRTLKRLFRYDAKRGHLYWRKRINFSIKLDVHIGAKQYAKGKRAMVRINKILYYVSRVIWKLVTGKDPGHKEVDHSDRNFCNDKWKNLSLLTRKANLGRRDLVLIANNSRRQLLTQKFGQETWTEQSRLKWRESMGLL